eukprot:3942576-Prymnesium_polylepis.1
MPARTGACVCYGPTACVLRVAPGQSFRKIYSVFRGEMLERNFVDFWAAADRELQGPWVRHSLGAALALAHCLVRLVRFLRAALLFRAARAEEPFGVASPRSSRSTCRGTCPPAICLHGTGRVGNADSVTSWKRRARHGVLFLRRCRPVWFVCPRMLVCHYSRIMFMFVCVGCMAV